MSTKIAAQARTVLAGVEQLAGGLGTAVLALLLLAGTVATAALCLLGVGLLLVPPTPRAVRSLADRERARLGRWGAEPAGPGPLPAGLRPALGDRTARRELAWLAAHATLGLLTGLAGLSLPLWAVREATLPLWWSLVPAGDASDQLGLWTVTDRSGAVAVAVVLGLGWTAASVLLTPVLVRVQAGTGRRLLRPGPGIDLTLRVTELTATRAAALDAHATELRRIERALHDGTQNRLVAVTVLLGAARRALSGHRGGRADPAGRRGRPPARRGHRRRPDAADPHRRGHRRGRRGPPPAAWSRRPGAVRVRRAGLATDLLAGGPAGLGYLLEERVGRVEAFLDALHRVAAGGTAIDPEVVGQLLARPDAGLDRLTARERDVLALMAQGLGNAAIAAELVVGDGAVHKHIRSIFAKLDLPPADQADRRVAAVLRHLDATRRRT